MNLSLNTSFQPSCRGNRVGICFWQTVLGRIPKIRLTFAVARGGGRSLGLTTPVASALFF